MSTADERPAPFANPATALCEEADGWGVLVNLDSGHSVALNPTGLAIWRLLDGRRTAGDLASHLVRGFRNAPPGIAGEVEALLATLAEDGFVGYELTGGAPGGSSSRRGEA